MKDEPLGLQVCSVSHMRGDLTWSPVTGPVFSQLELSTGFKNRFSLSKSR